MHCLIYCVDTIGKVLSMPKSYGLESEQGRLAPFDEICPYNIGDMVFIRVCYLHLHVWYKRIALHVNCWIGSVGNRAIEHRAWPALLLVPQGRAHHRCGQVERLLSITLYTAGSNRVIK